MNHTHLPRSLIILLFILVIVTFIGGTLRTFAPAHAATVLEGLAQITTLASTSTSIVDFPPPGPTPAPTFTPAPTQIPAPKIYITDMNGIIALAILLVVVILVGMVWGIRNPRKK